MVVKHQGKKYDVEVDTSSTGEVFKYQMFSLTGVEPERQKILIKGVLKDDTSLSTLGLKDGQTIMMMGTLEVPASSDRQRSPSSSRTRRKPKPRSRKELLPPAWQTSAIPAI